MKSTNAKMRSVIEKMNKKGQVITTTTNVVIGLMVFLFVVFAVLFGISALNPSSFFTTGSVEANATNALQQNTTSLVSNFSQRLPTLGTVLGVVLIMGALLLLIVFIARFRGQAGGGGGTAGL